MNDDNDNDDTVYTWVALSGCVHALYAVQCACACCARTTQYVNDTCGNISEQIGTYNLCLTLKQPKHKILNFSFTLDIVSF